MDADDGAQLQQHRKQRQRQPKGSEHRAQVDEGGRVKEDRLVVVVGIEPPEERRALQRVPQRVGAHLRDQRGVDLLVRLGVRLQLSRRRAPQRGQTRHQRAEEAHRESGVPGHGRSGILRGLTSAQYARRRTRPLFSGRRHRRRAPLQGCAAGSSSSSSAAARPYLCSFECRVPPVEPERPGRVGPVPRRLVQGSDDQASLVGVQPFLQARMRTCRS